MHFHRLKLNEIANLNCLQITVKYRYLGATLTFSLYNLLNIMTGFMGYDSSSVYLPVERVYLHYTARYYIKIANISNSDSLNLYRLNQLQFYQTIGILHAMNSLSGLMQSMKQSRHKTCGANALPRTMLAPSLNILEVDFF